MFTFYSIAKRGERMDDVQIYRKQGLAIVTVHLKGEEEFQQSTSDYDILLTSSHH